MKSQFNPNRRFEEAAPPGAAGDPGPTSPGRGIIAWLVPCFLAFIASFCIMTIELVASRIIARHLGNSLYTWTAVIGVVLGGISIGNYLGGWIADLFRPRPALAVLFLISALGALAIPFLNGWVGEWEWWKMVWSMRIFIHVCVVFSIPSILLGLIGPVVAKWALESGRPHGRAVGNVYAWGALGSIAGTFATGYYFIAAFGTISVVVGVAIILALIGLLISLRITWPFVVPVGALFALALIQGPWVSPWIWDQKKSVLDVRTAGDACAFLTLRTRKEMERSNRVYLEESQYSFIKIENEEEGSRSLILDNLIHAYINSEDVEDLQYDYEGTYKAVVYRSVPPDRPLSALFIGGGGFVFPRYLRHRFPGSHIEVAEIDPEITRANFEAFFLKHEEARVFRRFEEMVDLSGEERQNPPIWIRNLDARNHIADLVRRKRSGEKVEFDLIFGDAFNDYSVPFHLTTLEFNRMVEEILAPESGVYMINVIDIFDSGKFLGAVVNTFNEVFKHVYVFCNTDEGPDLEEDGRDTFVVVGSKKELKVDDLPAEGELTSFEGSLLNQEHLAELKEKSKGLVLTDDYAPVEQLLTNVVTRRSS